MKLCNYQEYYFLRVFSLPNCFYEDKHFNNLKVWTRF